MFTGLIEEIGTVRFIKKANNGAVISVQCKKILEDIKIGDSIAINGACQTAVKFDSSGFDADVSTETLKLTNLGELNVGDKVNLERAMGANGRFGGHFVTGHIEGKGKFINRVNQGNSTLYYFSAPQEIEKYIVYKGSICLNGISLTVASLEDNVFSVAVIPHTESQTLLSELKEGANVNLETDIIAKYVEKFLGKSDNTKKDISLDYLKEHGFY